MLGLLSNEPSLLGILEDVFDPSPEQPRDPERERQAGVVLARFERVHGLARDIELGGEIALRPLPLGAQGPLGSSSA
jgi:hypothetical protein